MKYDRETFQRAIRSAFKNKETLHRASVCACYYCRKEVAFTCIKDWTDNGLTALCPHCGVDSVISGDDFPISDPKFLEELNLAAFWAPTLVVK